MAVFRFVRASLRGETLFRFGDGESSWRDYAHVPRWPGLFEAMHATTTPARPSRR